MHYRQFTKIGECLLRGAAMCWLYKFSERDTFLRQLPLPQVFLRHDRRIYDRGAIDLGEGKTWRYFAWRSMAVGLNGFCTGRSVGTLLRCLTSAKLNLPLLQRRLPNSPANLIRLACE